MLALRQEDLNLTPAPKFKKKKRSGIMTGTCLPALGMRGQADPWDFPAGQPSLISKLHILEAPSEEGGQLPGTTFEFDL